MTVWEAVFCGILQGLTEFLPISSSGHLALAHAFLGMETSESYLTFDILLHFATLIVVFVVYHKDIFSLVPAFFTMTGKVFRGNFRLLSWSDAERTVLLLLIATLPLSVAFFVKDSVEFLSGYARAVGLALILNGILLLTADRFSKKSKRTFLSARGAFGVGLFQLAALFPGLSRSGSTIAGGMLFGLSRQNAVKFSFLMSIPAVLGANLFNVPEMLQTEVAPDVLGYYLLGMAAAMLFGFLSIRFLNYISSKENFGFFAYYCMTIGAVSVFLG